jgi:3-deoxy-D-manno-octulosonate 8-phosphate phosphatase KdsC-like HAD superfamily phosphatase
LFKKVISIDLDGVLNTYSGHHDYDENKICPIKEGAYEFLEKLSKIFDIEIFTVRDKELVENWIKENNISKFISKVTDKKNPYSQIILDDRAIQFKGDYIKTYQEIIDFKPYWK